MIKKLVTIAALAMLLGSPTSYAVPIARGNDLVADCADGAGYFMDGFCYGYVNAVFDIAQNHLICAPDGVSRRQLVSIVKKYLKENPQYLHGYAHGLVESALMKAFPCSD